MRRKTLTILFVDLQGYTSRTARQSRDENELLVQELKSFIEKHTSQYGGTFVKAMGDGFLLTFESPTDAIVCGQEMQAKIEQRNANVLNKDNFVRFRIGISTGEVTMDDDGDVYGDAVNIASRIQSFAEPNDVYISEATYLAMNKSEINAMDLGPQTFKNVLKEVRVYKVLKDSSDVAAIPSVAQKRNVLPLILSVAGAVIVAALLFYLISMLRQPDIEALFEKRDYGAVIELGEQLLEEDPENMRIHELMIMSLIKLRDFPQLKNRLREAHEVFHDLTDLCPPIIEFLRQEGEHQIARNIERRHCSQEPFSQRENQPFRRGQDMRQGFSEPSFREQRPDRQEQPFRREDEDRDVPPKEPLSEEQRQDIQQLMEEEQFDEVIQWGERQLEENPGSIETREMLSEAYARMQDFDRAEQLLREAYEMVPDATHLLFRIAEIHEEKGEYREAINVFMECTQSTHDEFQRREAFQRIRDIKQRIRPEGHFRP